MGRIVFVTGGARSGKSSHAEQLAAALGSEIVYIATARAGDSEMAERIARHRLQRPAAWKTVEEPLCPSAVVEREGGRCTALLLDCLTVLITNRMLALSVDWDNADSATLNAVEEHVLVEIKALIRAATAASADLIAVGNEVGCGIVPVSPLSRLFRDCAGRVNQQVAAAAAEVWLVAAGIPLRIKG
ncbi:MAG: bifunctional adenosylcobinamide kinase/adenosylcobinamide-phosphate guanylyltransferase [Desulfobulbus sp.]|jgi:adenosylcobinamide kinase/adenosylcobinamide-phosphate guanylyltransferase